MKSIWEFIYSTLLRREYPLIKIPRKPSFTVPYASSIPDRIMLIFAKDEMEKYNVTEDNIAESIMEILEHEYIHIVLWKLHQNRASAKLNDINGWGTKSHKMIWKLKVDGNYVWETIDGTRV